MEAAVLEGGEEVAPVDLGLAQSDADPENRGGGREQGGWRAGEPAEEMSRAAELFEDGGDAACGDALDIHLGDGQSQGALAAGAAFKGGGIKVHAATDLRDGEGELAQGC